MAISTSEHKSHLNLNKLSFKNPLLLGATLLTAGAGGWALLSPKAAEAMTPKKPNVSSSLAALGVSNTNEVSELEALAPEKHTSYKQETPYSDKVDSIRKPRPWDGATINFTVSPVERQMVYNILWNNSRTVPVMETFPLGAPERSLNWYSEKYGEIYDREVPKSWGAEEKAYALAKLCSYFIVRNNYEDPKLASSNGGSQHGHISFHDLTNLQFPSSVCQGFAIPPCELFNAIASRRDDIRKYKARDIRVYHREFHDQTTNAAAPHAVWALQAPDMSWMTFFDTSSQRHILHQAGVKSGLRGLKIDPIDEPTWGGVGGTSNGIEQEIFFARSMPMSAKWKNTDWQGSGNQRGTPNGFLEYDDLRTQSDFMQRQKIKLIHDEYWKNEAKYKGAVATYHRKIWNEREKNGQSGGEEKVTLNTSFSGR